MALARTREALHNSWDKNDPTDAQVILHMLRIGASQRYYDPLANGINDIQELSKIREVVSRTKTEILHRLQGHYLPLYFPEADRFRNNSRSDWFSAFLERFPTPASITALSQEAFTDAAWDLVGRKMAKARLLADIYETARASIGLPVSPDAAAIAMFRMVLAEARSLIRPSRTYYRVGSFTRAASEKRPFIVKPVTQPFPKAMREAGCVYQIVACYDRNRKP